MIKTGTLQANQDILMFLTAINEFKDAQVRFVRAYASSGRATWY